MSHGLRINTTSGETLTSAGAVSTTIHYTTLDLATSSTFTLADPANDYDTEGTLKYIRNVGLTHHTITGGFDTGSSITVDGDSFCYILWKYDNDQSFAGDWVILRQKNINLPSGFMIGFNQVNTSTTVMSFGTTGEDSLCRSSDASWNLAWNGIKTITLSTVGVGGISDTQDPSTLDTAYEVYAVGDTTSTNQTNILAVEVDTDITTVLEFTSNDYNVYKRIGYFRTLNGANTIIPHMTTNNGRSNTIHYTGDRGEQTVLFSGSSTSFTDMINSGHDTSSYTAPGASNALFRIAFGASAASNDQAGWRENGSSVTLTTTPYTISPGIALGGTELFDGQILLHLGSDRILEYSVTSASNDLYCYVIAFTYLR